MDRKLVLILVVLAIVGLAGRSGLALAQGPTATVGAPTTAPTAVLTPAATSTSTVTIAQLQQQINDLQALLPGLGEFMIGFQLHIAKVWFAGENGNWPLAKFETGEIIESMDGAKASRPAAGPLLDAFTNGTLAQLDKAIDAQDKAQFETAYQQTVAACNTCHVAYTADAKYPQGRSFIIITVPTQPPVPNQQWTLPTTTPSAATTPASGTAAGQALFQAKCASCHGPDGAGGIKIGAATSADLRQAALQPMYHNDATLLRRAILDGVNESGNPLDPAMPRWRGQLSDAQVDSIIAYLMALK